MAYGVCCTHGAQFIEPSPNRDKMDWRRQQLKWYKSKSIVCIFKEIQNSNETNIIQTESDNENCWPGTSQAQPTTTYVYLQIYIFLCFIFHAVTIAKSE